LGTEKRRKPEIHEEGSTQLLEREIKAKSLKTSAWWMRKTFEENVEICRQLIRKVLF